LTPGPRRGEYIELLIEYFAIMFRFQDDEWVLDNTLILRAHCNDAYWGPDANDTTAMPDADHPLRGLYPSTLTITADPSAYSGTLHQDVEILRRRVATGRWYYYTRVHDKKYAPVNADVAPYMILYQKPNTYLTPECIYGVVFSETRRFHVKTTQVGDFIQITARMAANMIYMGYDEIMVKRYIRKFFLRVPQLYGKVKPLISVLPKVYDELQSHLAILHTAGIGAR